MPRPEKGARLSESVAQAVGLVSSWTSPSEARPVELPDGTKKTLPDGSVVLQQIYNPEHPWPEYTWPDGSL